MPREGQNSITVHAKLIDDLKTHIHRLAVESHIPNYMLPSVPKFIEQAVYEKMQREASYLKDKQIVIGSP